MWFVQFTLKSRLITHKLTITVCFEMIFAHCVMYTPSSIISHRDQLWESVSGIIWLLFEKSRSTRRFVWTVFQRQWLYPLVTNHWKSTLMYLLFVAYIMTWWVLTNAVKKNKKKNGKDCRNLGLHEVYNLIMWNNSVLGKDKQGILLFAYSTYILFILQ